METADHTVSSHGSSSAQRAVGGVRVPRPPRWQKSDKMRHHLLELSMQADKAACSA